MCAIFGDVESLDEVFNELQAFFEVSRCLEIYACGTVQQESEIYFCFAILGKDRYNMVR